MLTPFESYIYGLVLTDGSLYFTTRNRGKVSIELNRKDSELLYKLQEKIPHSSVKPRTRNTNFKHNSQTMIFTNSQRNFREFFVKNGIPEKDKSTKGIPPITLFSESDFWRGVYDGNGSLGFTSNDEPFISLVTKSEPLKTELLNLLETKFGIIKQINPNNRDNVYNITLKNEDAISFSEFLYKDSSIYMQRKYEKYIEIQKWVRTKPKISSKSWSDYELEYIKTHSVEDSMIKLNRTKNSIKMRLWRLQQK